MYDGTRQSALCSVAKVSSPHATSHKKKESVSLGYHDDEPGISQRTAPPIISIPRYNKKTPTYH